MVKHKIIRFDLERLQDLQLAQDYDFDGATEPFGFKKREISSFDANDVWEIIKKKRIKEEIGNSKIISMTSKIVTNPTTFGVFEEINITYE